MFRKKFYPKTCNSSILFFERQYSRIDAIVQNRLQITSQFIDHLDIEFLIRDDETICNCLEWSTDGKLLASGSKSNVMICDPFKRTILDNLVTGEYDHVNSVKFLPKTRNSLIATGSASILIFDLNKSETPIWNCTCHSEVKRLETAPETPFLFWSCGDDGNVLQFDVREKHKCEFENRVLLINLPTYLGVNAKAYSISVNPRRPELIAVGGNDAYARLYDRRMMHLSRVENRSELIREDIRNRYEIPENCVTYYCPGNLSKYKSKYNAYDMQSITYLTFNSDGTELLVNMGDDHIYIYDINNAEKPNFFNFLDYRQNTNTPKRTLEFSERAKYFEQMGNLFLKNQQYIRAVYFYSHAIQLAPDSEILYFKRARAFKGRLWYGDSYAALRDCHTALKLNPFYEDAYFEMAEAFLDLGRIQEASDSLDKLVIKIPIYRNGNVLHKFKRKIATKARELNMQPENIFRRSDDEWIWRSEAKDYKDRFVGRSNRMNDRIEATFLGNDGNYIVAASDDGELFIWERPTNTIKQIYLCDFVTLNCVRPHPNICMLATSGVDHLIKIWSPFGDFKNTDLLIDIECTVERIQEKLKDKINEILDSYRRAGIGQIQN